VFSYSIESHTGLQERVGGDSFATKAGAPVYLAMEHAPLSPVFTAVGNFAASVTDPTQRPTRWATEREKEPSHEKGNKVVRSSSAAESAAIASLGDPETKQLLLSLKSPDLLTRCRSAEGLAQVGDVQVLDTLAAHIRTRDLTTCKDADSRYDSLLPVRATTMLLAGSASASRLREKLSAIRNPESDVLKLVIQAFY
jgi:hypothetical protein